MKAYELTAEQLYQPTTLTAAALGKIAPKNDIIGQEKALEALTFGLKMTPFGYHIFASGIKGVGRTRLTLNTLKKFAAKRPAPKDWCYVFNFDDPYRPMAISFDAGMGKMFARYMGKTLTHIQGALAKIWQDDHYKMQVDTLQNQIRAQKRAEWENLKKAIETPRVMLTQNDKGGIMLTPVLKGKPLGPKEFNALPLNERKKRLNEMNALQARLMTLLKDKPNLDAQLSDQLHALQQELVVQVVQTSLKPIQRLYRNNAPVQAYLDAVQADLTMHAPALADPQTPIQNLMGIYKRYHVNALITHDADQGAPVVHLTNLSVPSLIGKIERTQQAGTVVSDHTMIQPGTLLKANGGYLVIEAKDLLSAPKVWTLLKESLFAAKVRLDSRTDSSTIADICTLEPQAIDLDVKVVLIGDTPNYFAFCEMDEAFQELFKIYAHFHAKTHRTQATERSFAAQIKFFAEHEHLKPLTPAALAFCIEQSARWAEHKQDLSLFIADLRNLVREADILSARQKATDKVHIEKALALRQNRFSALQDDVLEMIERGTLSIAVKGKAVGQLNALAVQHQGPFLFGRPNRITCQIRPGKGDLIDIEREVELGGPLHSKGVLILSSFLSARFSGAQPLALDASLVFEQSYLPVDGDSASSAELFCLLSAIADLPMNQGIAATGAVNQLGQVQAIGAVNEKIEGFFRVCQKMGFNKKQGVIIPRANVQNLMLSSPVRQAVKAGKFHIYAIDTVDEGMEILTGLPAGTLGKNGFTPGSINARITQNLHRFYMRTQSEGKKA